MRLAEGDRLQSVMEAVRTQRAKRGRARARRGLPSADGGCPSFVGASRECTLQERAALLPPYSGRGDLAGIPYILQSVPVLQEEARWPTHPDVHPLHARCTLIAKEAGIPVRGDEGDGETNIELRKYLRGVLPSGESICSTEYKRPFVTDDSWCLIHYDEERRQGGSERVYYVGHIRLLVEARLVTDDEVNCPPRLRPDPMPAPPADSNVATAPMPVLVLDLYRARRVSAPGSRRETGVRPHDFWAADNDRVQYCSDTGRPKSPYAGRWAAHVDQIDTQLLRGPCVKGVRYFSVCSKSSGMVRRGDQFESRDPAEA